MNKSGFICAAVAVLGLAGACAPGSVALQSQIGSAYDLQNFGNYHRDRDTRVEILGSTLGMEPGAFAEAVTTAMQGSNLGGPTRFTVAPGPSADTRARVVLAFNGAPASADALCAARQIAPGGGGGTTVQAAWCFGARGDSYVIARTGAVTGSGDPLFRSLVAQTTRALFPRIWDHKINEVTDD